MDNQRYNVLFIQTDQWSQNFMGYRGCSEIMTPTIDQLARDGVIYTNCYSTCPVCIPARRSLMTGMSPRSHGDRVYSDRMKMPEAKTLAQAFRMPDIRLWQWESFMCIPRETVLVLMR